MKKARSSITGQFVTIKYAIDNPSTTQIEEMPSPKEVAEAKRDQ